MQRKSPGDELVDAIRSFEEQKKKEAESQRVISVVAAAVITLGVMGGPISLPSLPTLFAPTASESVAPPPAKKKITASKRPVAPAAPVARERKAPPAPPPFVPPPVAKKEAAAPASAPKGGGLAIEARRAARKAELEKARAEGTAPAPMKLPDLASISTPEILDDLPEMPEMPEIPEITLSVPSISTPEFSLPTLPQTPELPPMPALPAQLAALPSLPDLSAVTLPSLPKLSIDARFVGGAALTTVAIVQAVSLASTKSEAEKARLWAQEQENTADRLRTNMDSEARQRLSALDAAKKAEDERVAAEAKLEEMRATLAESEQRMAELQAQIQAQEASGAGASGKLEELTNQLETERVAKKREVRRKISITCHMPHVICHVPHATSLACPLRADEHPSEGLGGGDRASAQFAEGSCRRGGHGRGDARGARGRAANAGLHGGLHRGRLHGERLVGGRLAAALKGMAMRPAIRRAGARHLMPRCLGRWRGGAHGAAAAGARRWSGEQA